jgi:hypothetical protein
VHWHAAARKRKRDATRPNSEFEGAAACGELGEEVDDRIDLGRIEHLAR